MKLCEKNLNKFSSGYEIWFSKKKVFFHFDTASEAYIFYLNKYATFRELDWLRRCMFMDSVEETKTLLLNMPLTEDIVRSQFNSVFNRDYHFYRVEKRQDNQIIRV